MARAESMQTGTSCPGCGLANYAGMCPHCRGDQDAYERELVPPFPSTQTCDHVGHEWADAGGGLLICMVCQAEQWGDPRD